MRFAWALLYISRYFEDSLRSRLEFAVVRAPNQKELAILGQAFGRFRSKHIQHAEGFHRIPLGLQAHDAPYHGALLSAKRQSLRRAALVAVRNGVAKHNIAPR